MPVIFSYDPVLNFYFALTIHSVEFISSHNHIIENHGAGNLAKLAVPVSAKQNP